MKTLQEEIGSSLVGRSETITMTEFRNRPGNVMAQVELGKTFTITKDGKIIAVLSRPEPDAFELGSECRRIGIA